MSSPADLNYLSRRQMEELIQRIGMELEGSLLLFKALVAKVGPVDLTTDEVTSATEIEVSSTPIEGGFRIAVERSQKDQD